MPDNISSRIDLYYDSLSKGHKKIADFIRTNYEKSSFMTAAELGRAVGISESTVVRFAVNIGFSGYPELQKNLQEMVKSRLTSVQRMEAAKRNDGRDFLDSAFSSDIDTIKKTLDGLSREDFNGAVNAINSARRIYILGVRSSASIASFAAFYMSFLYDVVLVDTSATSEMFEQMFRIDKNDVCVAISFPRYSSRTVKALKFARSRGAEIISVTDSEISPIAPLATYLLLAGSSMVSFVDSLTAPLSLVTALVAASADKREKDVHESLEQLEQIWDEYHVYRTGEDDK
ncbi:MAG: MurR/RpiR family transcriptional regulator [Clostridia bacterium]|nr:MurR/RpiR family transcriptional regulator [Clostridia bacterium]MBR6701743.1 MurR/RpiR family transcriptional regulator [Clostridia bacterium]